MLGFWALPISRNCKQRFGNWLCFRPQVKERRDILCWVPWKGVTSIAGRSSCLESLTIDGAHKRSYPDSDGCCEYLEVCGVATQVSADASMDETQLETAAAPFPPSSLIVQTLASSLRPFPGTSAVSSPPSERPSSAPTRKSVLLRELQRRMSYSAQNGRVFRPIACRQRIRIKTVAGNL
jgi:hypothetical protein